MQAAHIVSRSTANRVRQACLTLPAPSVQQPAVRAARVATYRATTACRARKRVDKAHTAFVSWHHSSKSSVWGSHAFLDPSIASISFVYRQGKADHAKIPLHYNRLHTLSRLSPSKEQPQVCQRRCIDSHRASVQASEETTAFAPVDKDIPSLRRHRCLPPRRRQPGRTRVKRGSPGDAIGRPFSSTYDRLKPDCTAMSGLAE